ncbi:MAG: tRNA 2-thiouridine(34) synthase MnmA [Oligoflexia bacterium]|nr:tRNA 2-thiouridine(34) synthase MnmA [Oligoflexia bacterium]
MTTSNATTYTPSGQSSATSRSGHGKRVLVAMSGGVDSSVTAALLKTQGYEVIGVHMQLWNHGEANLERMGGRCCSLIDSNDARRVCDKIDVPYYVINAQDVFQEKVVDYFVHEYLENRTPNPCVQCNTKIKFNYLFQKADELDCEFVATGHYAQVEQDELAGVARLKKAIDPQKDQTYFLFGLTQKALQRTLMPLGAFPKMAVRKLAEEYGLAVAKKADSQEICFIGTEGYKNFLEERVTPELRPRGVIKTIDGTIVGEHEGLHRYTIGQRKGLQQLLERGGKQFEDYFVVDFDTVNHSLIVGPEELLYTKELIATEVNWLNFPKTENALRGVACRARIRSRHEEAECLVTTFENNSVHVEFKEAQRAITPGQAVVFYVDNEVIGGGFIDKVIRPKTV